jgi:N6-adenosine-specific RNA methylase IME4
MTRYRVVVADPPWPMEWRGGATYRRNGRGVLYKNGASRKTLPYATMAVPEIALLPVDRHAGANAMLFLWCPDKLVIDGSAQAVCKAWGFTPQRFFVWAKNGFGMGTFPRPQHELVLIGKRGTLAPRRRDVGSVQRWKFVYEKRGKTSARRHSAKPPGFLAMVESLFDGPYLELFARSPRLGWTSWGDEVASSFDLFAEALA